MLLVTTRSALSPSSRFVNLRVGYPDIMINREELKGAAPDREPTPDEEAAAERALPDVDVDAVAEEYEHMTDIGARVHGEGQIEPDRP